MSASAEGPVGGVDRGGRHPMEGLGTPAAVLGVIAVGTCWLGWTGVVAGALALVVGFVAWRRAQRDPDRSGGLAVTAMVLGVLGLAAGLVFLLSSLLSGPSSFGQGQSLDECMAAAHGKDEQKLCASQHAAEYHARYPNSSAQSD